MTRALVAPDSFKGTFSAAEVATAIATGLRAGGVDADECPVADGGEGTLEIVLRAVGGVARSAVVSGPSGSPVEAAWGWFPESGLAVIESAQACGLHLSPRTPLAALEASTRGVGELIRVAADHGARRVLVTVGGTATTDGGAGLLAALGDADLSGVRVEVLSDVTVAFGDAATVFAPQKGADEATVALLTARLDEMAERLVRRFGRDPRSVPGTGAGGGISGALWSALRASIDSGADAVLDLVEFDRRLDGADVVIVGEGRLDAQSLDGKIIGAIVARAGDLPVHAVAGQVDLTPEQEDSLRLAGCWTATTLLELEEAGRSIAATIRA